MIVYNLHLSITTDMIYYHIKIMCYDCVNLTHIKHNRYDLLSYQKYNVKRLCNIYTKSFY